ncbi:AEC family transporter [Leucothrix pacifica]|uniref:AEC family transporter n=1 Tax=Leucothrix pacifica TaxID=1247513 RepID=A0A317CK30_9GAMM|nr:AEC family transporter [Leucothrix pacifica]PWQ98856.1 AEC family transporter [Leucothrix pacifica]
MLDIITIVLPVFLVVGTGYLTAYFKYFTAEQASALMRFATQLAIPCLLFLAVANLDLAKEFNPSVLLPFYIGALSSFVIVWLGAGLVFKHNPGVRVAIGFAGLFSNLVLIGLAIVELAYGADALKVAFAIVAIHAPFCYVLGITAMEFSRADGLGFAATMRVVFKQVFSNTLMLGILLGFIVNLAHITIPAPMLSALELFARSALPVALFGLGAMLVSYRLRSGLGEVGLISISMLIIHPLIAYLLGRYAFDLAPEVLKPVVLMAAMPPGMNVYIFATMYDRATGIAASSVLLSTVLSVVTISVWLIILA